MKIEGLRSGGIIANYCCSSSCGHCLYNCHPGREKAYMNMDTLYSIIDVLKANKCFSVHIGGGEPFLRPDDLISVIDVLTKNGIEVEYVETNSSWVNSRTGDILKEIKNSGCNTLLLSISPFHLEYIPLKKIDALFDAASSVGIGMFPWQEQFYRPLSRLDKAMHHDFSRQEAALGSDFISQSIDAFGITSGGKALELFSRYKKQYSIEEINLDSPCRNLASTSHFHIDLYGEYIPGLCTGFSIPITELSEEIEEHRYNILNLLYHKGPSAFLEFCSNRGFIAKESYSGKCDLCNHMRTWLFLQEEQYRELGPDGYYETFLSESFY